SLVPTKRGAHLFLSLERIEALRPQGAPPLQRIGLSATQRPLDEVARLLGGGAPKRKGEGWEPREVAIVDAGSKRAFEVRIEVPVEDMSKPGERSTSIWPSIHPRLVELVRDHR